MITHFKNKYGSIEMYCNQEELDTYRIVAKGIISLSLLRRYLVHLKKMDRESSGKFNHIVDTSNVILANPLNPIYLRAISKLEHIHLYIVIVPSAFLRFLVNLTKWINKPDYVFKSGEQFDLSTLVKK
ncbi:MAG: hypothetical protein ABJH72_03435 [Reichenbachiella sp.]|uniref:hypothetical protein n=1 Tax=Reichenbachiella sp. TaxID=2184521 RepID=UPI003267DD8E